MSNEPEYAEEEQDFLLDEPRRDVIFDNVEHRSASSAETFVAAGCDESATRTPASSVLQSAPPSQVETFEACRSPVG